MELRTLVDKQPNKEDLKSYLEQIIDRNIIGETNWTGINGKNGLQHSYLFNILLPSKYKFFL